MGEAAGAAAAVAEDYAIERGLAGDGAEEQEVGAGGLAGDKPGGAVAAGSEECADECEAGGLTGDGADGRTDGSGWLEIVHRSTGSGFRADLMMNPADGSGRISQKVESVVERRI